MDGYISNYQDEALVKSPMRVGRMYYKREPSKLKQKGTHYYSRLLIEL